MEEILVRKTFSIPVYTNERLLEVHGTQLNVANVIRELFEEYKNKLDKVEIKKTETDYMQKKDLHISKELNDKYEAHFRTRRRVSKAMAVIVCEYAETLK